MLRFLVGLTLLVSAITLRLHAPARGEERLWPEQYLKLLERLHPLTEAEREKELKRLEEARKRSEQADMERQRVYEKMRSLKEVGPTFVFQALDGFHPLGGVKAACLVGETGNIYMYDFRKDGAQAPSVVNGREFSKAVDLAKSFEPVGWRPVHARTAEHVADIHDLIWYVLLDGRTIALQIAGDYVGAHPNPQAAELVKLIDGWCPYAQEIRSRLDMPAFEGHPRPPY